MGGAKGIFRVLFFIIMTNEIIQSFAHFSQKIFRIIPSLAVSSVLDVMLHFQKNNVYWLVSLVWLNCGDENHSNETIVSE